MNKCPYLNVNSAELSKVKVEFRDYVKSDAEKCIKEECPAYYNGTCNNPSSPAIQVKIGDEGYMPDQHMLEQV